MFDVRIAGAKTVRGRYLCGHALHWGDEVGFRFQRRIRLGKSGFYLNLGKRGFSSISAGVRGAHVTVGKRGIRSTVGLPGTGLSYTTTSGGRQSRPNAAPTESGGPASGNVLGRWAFMGLVVFLLARWAQTSEPASIAAQTIAARPISLETTAPTVFGPAASESTAPRGPSFNCAIVRTQPDNIICGDLELSRLDLAFSILYKKAMNAAPDRGVFVHDNRRELLRRQRTCVDRACLLRWYSDRTEALSGGLTETRN